MPVKGAIPNPPHFKFIIITAIILTLLTTASLFTPWHLLYTLPTPTSTHTAPVTHPPPTTPPPHRSPDYRPACTSLLRNPLPYADCARDLHNDWTNPSCPNGTTTFQGKSHQDYYLYTRHFRHLPRPGVYLDVASNDPVRASNTWFLDACLRWRGLCVEANPHYVRRLRAARSCSVTPTCVGGRHGEEVTFVLANARGGISATNKNMGKFGEGQRRNVVGLTCTTVGRVLKGEGVQRVDYFSLDVEGHELPVLRGIDWANFKADVITIEVTKNTFGDISRFLKQRGYVQHFPTLTERSRKTGLLTQDVVFLHKSVTFGKPQ